jgi:hypothetical protein
MINTSTTHLTRRQAIQLLASAVPTAAALPALGLTSQSSPAAPADTFTP